MLSTKHLPFAHTKKFCNQFVGLFTKVQLIGPSSVLFTLSRMIQGLYPDFFVSFLGRYQARSGRVAPLPPIIIDNEVEYIVKALVSHYVCQ